MTDLRPWFALKCVPGVGNLMFRRLVDRFGSPAAALAAGDEELRAVRGVTPRLIGAMRSETMRTAVDRELAAVARVGCQVVCLTDSGYPPLLREIADPPPLLYVNGTLPVDRLAIAVVGSRNATGYGIATTRQLCMDLARQRTVIVSGMARGVDTTAHAGAIAAGGLTVAVLGTGLDRIYPRENTRLYHQIAENGAVISEFALGTGPDAHHFPARNRIISGMCHGTLVVEATRRSGSLITARLAAEQNREVFAVPGNIHSFKSVGTHGLIRDGAKLVMHAGDILEEFDHLRTQPAPPSPQAQAAAATYRPTLTAEEAVVIDRLEFEPIHIDDLARTLALPSARIAGLLLQLELKGLVCQSPGKRFCLAPGVDGSAQKTISNQKVESSE